MRNGCFDFKFFFVILKLSFGTSSPALSNRKRFKTFYRTHPTATLNNPARMEIFKMYNWTKFAILQAEKEVFTSTADDLENEAKKYNMTILIRQTFTDDPSDAIINLMVKRKLSILNGQLFNSTSFLFLETRCSNNCWTFL
jgi:hypothetical protein